jgi:hypothetical protein
VTEDRSTWPRVTAVLKAAGLIDVARFTDFDRDRGTATHEAIRLWLEGSLDRASVDPAVAPRLAQFERFYSEARPDIMEVELEVAHSVHRYAGRLDLVAVVAGCWSVIDIKGPTRAPWHGLQVAAYGHAYYNQTKHNAPARYSLHLSDTDYRLVRHTSLHDWPRFVEALKAYRLSQAPGPVEDPHAHA